jgi:SAM-dependent methyltransferase
MISSRRNYIDFFFNQKTKNLSGDVLDIGGKKKNKRGSFIPNEKLRCFYLNNDNKTEPDFDLDANNFIIKDKKFDFFFISEVLEHLENPEGCLKSAYEILKNDGIGFISMPFLYRKHDDPKDYQRWTDTKLLKVLEYHKFTIIDFFPMGGIFSVVHDFWMYCSLNSKKNLIGIINKLLFISLSPILKFVDKKTKFHNKLITSGWFVIVKKK